MYLLIDIYELTKQCYKLQNGHQEHTPGAEGDRADAGWMRSVDPKALHG